MKKTCGIYKITSPSGKVYIGQSIDIYNRFARYKSLKCASQPRLYNSLLKHSFEKHYFEIIKICEHFELNDYERHFQDLYNSSGVFGLNCLLTKSKDKSGELNIETKNKIRKANTGNINSTEARKKISIANTGRKLSIETKNKISNSNKGHYVSEETRQKISQANNGNKYNVGKKLTEETKLKISCKLKGFKHSEITKNKMSKSQIGHFVSEENKRKLSDRSKGNKYAKKNNNN